MILQEKGSESRITSRYWEGGAAGQVLTAKQAKVWSCLVPITRISVFFLIYKISLFLSYALSFYIFFFLAFLSCLLCFSEFLYWQEKIRKDQNKIIYLFSWWAYITRLELNWGWEGQRKSTKLILIINNKTNFFPHLISNLHKKIWSSFRLNAFKELCVWESTHTHTPYI